MVVVQSQVLHSELTVILSPHAAAPHARRMKSGIGDYYVYVACR